MRVTAVEVSNNSRAPRQGCTRDDDKGIAVAVMCCDLKINRDFTQFIHAKTRCRELEDACCGWQRLRASERQHLWGLSSSPRSRLELAMRFRL